MENSWTIYGLYSSLCLSSKDEKHYMLMAFKSMGTGACKGIATSPNLVLFNSFSGFWEGEFSSDYGYLGLLWGLSWWLSGKATHDKET